MKKMVKDISFDGTKRIAKTINFDRYVLVQLEERARQCNTTCSNMINQLAKQYLVDEEQIYRMVAKDHNAAVYRYRLMAEEAKGRKELEIIDKEEKNPNNKYIIKEDNNETENGDNDEIE